MNLITLLHNYLKVFISLDDNEIGAVLKKDDNIKGALTSTELMHHFNFLMLCASI